jgi:hypothetical protein
MFRDTDSQHHGGKPPQLATALTIIILVNKKEEEESYPSCRQKTTCLRRICTQYAGGRIQLASVLVCFG